MCLFLFRAFVWMLGSRISCLLCGMLRMLDQRRVRPLGSVLLLSIGSVHLPTSQALSVALGAESHALESWLSNVLVISKIEDTLFYNFFLKKLYELGHSLTVVYQILNLIYVLGKNKLIAIPGPRELKFCKDEKESL